MPTTIPTLPSVQQAAATQRDASPCIGRQRLLERVERELAQHRPVTLRGAAGVGKSRLLSELAARHRGPVRLVGGAPGQERTPGARDAPDPAQEMLVLVDDAHRLSRLEVARLHGLTAQPWCRVVAAVASAAGPDAALGSWWEVGPWRRVEITPLDRRATAAHLEHLLGGLAEPRLIHEVWRITGGIPAAVEALVADAQEAGAIGPGADSWRLTGPLPLWRLGALTAGRLDGLGAAARRDLHILAMASPLPIRAAASLLDPRAVRELEARGLAHYRASARGRTLAIIDRVHAEVVRASMQPEERREVLTALAAAFDRFGVTGRRRLELARWRLEVGGWSAAQLGAASALAHQAGDPSLAGELADAAEALGDDAGARRIGALSRAERCAGSPVDPATGRSPCEHESACHPDTAEVDGVVRAQLLAVGTGRWSQAAGRLLAADTPGPQPDPTPRAHAALLLALGGDVAAATALLPGRGDLAPGDRAPAEACEDAPADAGLLAAAATAVVGMRSGDGALVRDAQDAIASLRREVGSACVTSMSEPLVAGAALLSDVERPLLERIAEASDEVDGSLRSFGAETGWWYAVEGWLRWRAGQLETARDRLVAATLACRSADPIRLRAVVVADLAVLAGLSGSVVEAEWRLSQVGSDRRHNRAVAHRCAVAELLVGLTRGGTQDLGPALLTLADGARADGRTLDAVEAWHLVARLGARPGHARQAATGLAGLEGAERAAVSPGVLAHVQAWSDGDAAALDGAARRLASEGRAVAAAEAAHQAVQLGGGERTAALAGALRAACMAVTTPALAGSTPIELSPRRRDAAVLAMAGLDGRTIAARLDVSVRTVENHLARVYRQVGVRGRQELSELFTVGVAPFDGWRTSA